MPDKNRISRRRFLGSAVVGSGSLGLSTFNSSSSDAKNVEPRRRKKDSSPREVSVLSITLEKMARGSKEKMIDQLLKRLDELAYYQPDIICLPETFATTVKSAETIQGSIVNAFSKVAEQQQCYLICPLHTIKEDKIYNSAILIDRKGDVVGGYDKIRPNEFECNEGVTPEPLPPPVFKTDFGIIGIQICFDCNWPNDWRSLKEQAAEIVFWPSAFPGGRMLYGLAWLNKYYIVGAPYTNPALIYDMSGDLISKSGKWEGYAFAKLNLEKVLCEVDYNVPKVNDIRKKYGDKVKIRFFHNEDWLIIESRSPDLTIQQIIDEFELMIHWDYIKRAEEYQKKFRM